MECQICHDEDLRHLVVVPIARHPRMRLATRIVVCRICGWFIKQAWLSGDIPVTALRRNHHSGGA